MAPTPRDPEGPALLEPLAEQEQHLASILSRRGLVIALIGIAISALAFRWILTPANHPDATSARTAAVWVQAILGVAATVVGWLYDRMEKGTGPGSREG